MDSDVAYKGCYLQTGIIACTKPTSHVQSPECATSHFTFRHVAGVAI